MDTIAERLESLRAIMREQHIDAWIVTGTDPHASEYVAPRWRTREWISGFTGSAGTVVVTLDRALLWVDSRYYLQGAQQISGTPFELQQLDAPGVVDHVQWLAQNLAPASRIGFDAETMTVSAKRNVERALFGRHLNVVGTDDWFERCWTDRPSMPNAPVVPMNDDFIGLTANEKLDLVRQECRRKGCTHTVLSSLDDIAWLLNVRGSDIAYNPVFLGYVLVGPDSAVLCASDERFDSVTAREIGDVAEIKPYDAIFELLAGLPVDGTCLYFSPDKTSVRLHQALPKGMAVLEGRDITTDLKAAKNESELEGMRRAHLLDGIALVKFLARLASSNQTYNEISLAKELERARSESDEYLGPSFAPIAGYRGHGALAHYSATDQSASLLEGSGLLVLDTGAQYSCGTTDVTRTLLFGSADDEMRRDYTLVLKGNLALAAQRFPQGTCGYQLDALARQHLWQYGFNYGHGTGHGLGFCLNVHEGPQNISPRPVTVALAAGMVVSDEPGIYREEQYGIRIENILAVKFDGTTEFGPFLSFEVLTLCPFERKLIDTSLLTSHEVSMVDSYHAWVREELSRHLDPSTAAWLAEATAAL